MAKKFEQQKITTTTPTGRVVFDIENYTVTKFNGSEILRTIDLRKEPFSLSDYTKLLNQ